jgi:hypothetical protein
VAAFYGDQGRLRIVSAPLLGTLVSVMVPTAPPGRAIEPPLRPEPARVP